MALYTNITTDANLHETTLIEKGGTRSGTVNKITICNNDNLAALGIALYIEDEAKVIDIPTKNIDLDIPSIPACLQLHDIDVIVRIRTLKDKKSQI